MSETKQNAEERLAGGDRPLSLSECAALLHMKRPNVAKFLARRGVAPAFPKAQGYFWWQTDIMRVKAEREEDDARMAADRRRRETAVAKASGAVDPEPEEEAAPVVRVVLGATQKAALEELMQRPVLPTNANRFALLRLSKRGYAERVEGQREYQLTTEGRRVAGEME